MNQEEIEEEKEVEGKQRNPLVIIGTCFLIIILILWSIPAVKIKLDPEPDFKKIPTLSSLTLNLPLMEIENTNHKINKLENFAKFVNPNDPLIRDIAVKISTESCVDKGKICNAKALYYFVRDNINYISDPKDFEYIETIRETLLTGGGDCESGVLLLASLEEAIGIDAQLVFIPGHVLTRIKLPEARKSYKLEGDWVYLDWTCKQCDFGETPYQIIINEKRYLEVP